MLRWLVLAGCVVALGWAGAAGATAPPVPPDTVPTTDNEFLPENEDLSDCVSALPPPSCGSEARGGWRQALVFVAIALGLAFIVWQIVRAARRRSR
jgi:hypothetical protein